MTSGDHPEMHLSSALGRVLDETLTVATVFWALCLVLVSLEATLGANTLIALVYLVSIPLLVGWLTWANRGFVLRVRRGISSVLFMGASVLLSSSVIILVGLVASANLKQLLVGA